MRSQSQVNGQRPGNTNSRSQNQPCPNKNVSIEIETLKLVTLSQLLLHITNESRYIFVCYPGILDVLLFIRVNFIGTVRLKPSRKEPAVCSCSSK